MAPRMVPARRIKNNYFGNATKTGRPESLACGFHSTLATMTGCLLPISIVAAGRYWPDMILKRHIRPLAEKPGIKKRFGWHPFRKTISTLLTGNGEDVKVSQELKRRANPNTTLALSAQAIPENVRKAQGKVVEMARKAAPHSAKPTPNRGFPSLVPRLCTGIEKKRDERMG